MIYWLFILELTVDIGLSPSPQVLLLCMELVCIYHVLGEIRVRGIQIALQKT